MLQNHLMQLFCLTAMEPPNTMDADSLRNEKVKVIQSTRLADSRDLTYSAIRSQYGAGAIKGKSVGGYRTEPNVNPQSTIPTYVAMKFFVDNWRWQGVPFYLRTGKRMPKKVSEIAIQFRDVPLTLFQSAAKQVSPNILALRIQPNEGIALKFEAKMPGADLRSRSVEMDFGYGKTFGVEGSDSYERLLLDCMLGDQTLFTRGDEVEAAWKVVTPALALWDQPSDPILIPQYQAGSWGPLEADMMLNRDGRQWRRL
jgi:glucose-6-phosphate 1-dehydrogenase